MSEKERAKEFVRRALSHFGQVPDDAAVERAAEKIIRQMPRAALSDEPEFIGCPKCGHLLRCVTPDRRGGERLELVRRGSPTCHSPLVACDESGRAALTSG